MLEMMVGGGFVWLILVLFGCALLSSAVADSKGRSGFIWFIAGFIFNIFGLIAIAGMPSLLYAPNKKTHARCPDCREFVYRDARVCKCCGCKLTGMVEEEKVGFLDRLVG